MKSAPYVYNEAIKIVEPSAGELACEKSESNDSVSTVELPTEFVVPKEEFMRLLVNRYANC